MNLRYFQISDNQILKVLTEVIYDDTDWGGVNKIFDTFKGTIVNDQYAKSLRSLNIFIPRK